MEKPTNTEFGILVGLYERLQPYQYFSLYSQMHRMTVNNEPETFIKMMSCRQEFTTQIAFLQTTERAFAIPELKIIKIDEDVLPMLEDTKPDYSNLRLKYPAMFINHQFKFGNSIMNGFLVVDYTEVLKLHPEYDVVKDKIETQIRILAVGINKDLEFESYLIHPLTDQKYESYTISPGEDQEAMEHLTFKIKNLACNLLNLLVNDDKDIEEVECTIPKEANIKREQKGKLPLRDTITIRIHGTLKKYITEYKSLRGSVGVRYYVGGFWRHLESEFYKNAKGKMQWIYPHYRGMNNLPVRLKRFVHIKGGEHEKTSIKPE
jgi:hypothetical protein